MKTFRKLIVAALLIFLLSITPLGTIADTGVTIGERTGNSGDIFKGSATADINDGGNATPPTPTQTPDAMNTPEPTATPSPTPLPSPTPSLPTPSPTPSNQYVPPEHITPPTPNPETAANRANPAVMAQLVGPQPTPFSPPRAVNPWRSSYRSPFDADGNLSTRRQEFSFRRNTAFQPVEAFIDYDIRPFGGSYIGDITRPVVYLTFDEGFYGGFMGEILDILRDMEVHAAFFICAAFVRTAPHLALRMIEEGHIVANHSHGHPDMSGMSANDIAWEIQELERLFYNATGHHMHRYFRFPYGAYSMSSLRHVHELGYRTLFWSLAFYDWNVNNQPGMASSFRSVTNHVHNGAVILLHSVSRSNTEALPYIIEHLRFMGFEFGRISEIFEN